MSNRVKLITKLKKRRRKHHTDKITQDGNNIVINIDKLDIHVHDCLVL